MHPIDELWKMKLTNLHIKQLSWEWAREYPPPLPPWSEPPPMAEPRYQDYHYKHIESGIRCYECQECYTIAWRRKRRAELREFLYSHFMNICAYCRIVTPDKYLVPRVRRQGNYFTSDGFDISKLLSYSEDILKENLINIELVCTRCTAEDPFTLEYPRGRRPKRKAKPRAKQAS